MTPPPPPMCGAPHPDDDVAHLGVKCELTAGHGGAHLCPITWPAAGLDETVRLPPIGETVRRRPPPVPVRELRGSELLRALADELDAEGLPPLPELLAPAFPDVDEDLVDGVELQKADQLRPASDCGRGCHWPGLCRAYGAPGCAMKAEEA